VCGRFTSTVESSEVALRFGVEPPERYRARYNVAPTQQVLAILDDANRGRRAEMMRWGLVPHWAKDPSTSFKMINARAETVLEKPAYRSLMRRHRCLVPADGFYEWRVGPDGKKEPVRFTLAAGSLFAFAGLWTSWVERQTGELLDSCTIITTMPNELVAPVHDRMPVILTATDEECWLDPSFPAEAAVSLLRPYPASSMWAAPVSRRVSNVRNDDPDLLVSVAHAA
jgi:putative SOS response-associated peptidase YedK